jgi:uncharacterized protein YndB with AHSA1/START domain
VGGASDVVEQSVVVGASRPTVFRCLTQSDLLSRWLQAPASIEPRVGGAVRIDFARHGTVVEGRVVDLRPDEGLAVTWGVSAGPQASVLPVGSTTVRVTLADVPGGTRVTLRHEGIPRVPGLLEGHVEGWRGYLHSLRSTAPLAAIEGTPEALWDRWFQAWGEPDAAARDALVDSVLSPEGTYVDAHASTEGRAALSEWIAACRRTFPGTTVARTGPVLHTGDALLVEWDARLPGGQVFARGVSHGRLTPDGRLRAVESFWRP